MSQSAQFAPPADVPVSPEGVLWTGPWPLAHDSIGQMTRRHVVALERAGLPVQLTASAATVRMNELVGKSPWEELGYEVQEFPYPGGEVVYLPASGQVGPVGRHIDHTLVAVTHTVLSADALRSILYPGYTRHDDESRAAIEKHHPRMIVMTVFERDALSDDEVRLLRKFGDVWVPCSRNVDVLERYGIKATYVPHPMTDERREKLVSPRQMPKTGSYVFYHIGKWEPRKNQVSIIQAFLEAFTPQDAAKLLIKTHVSSRFDNYPETPFKALEHLVPRYAHRGWTPETAKRAVAIRVAPMSEAEILTMHLVGHCYVSAAHAEGFDLPAFDAMTAGNWTIHTGFGGSEDFTVYGEKLWRDGDPLVPVHPNYGWPEIESGDDAKPAEWARVDRGRLVRAMAEAASGRKHGRHIEQEYRSNMDTVGKIMKNAIDRVLERSRA